MSDNLAGRNNVNKGIDKHLNFWYNIRTMPKIANKTLFLTTIKSCSNGANVVSRALCVEAANRIGMKYPPAWFVQDKTRSAGRGMFYIDVSLAKQSKIAPMTPPPSPVASSVATPSTPTQDRSVVYALTNGDSVSLVPDINPDYVPFGHYEDVKQVIDSGMFAPIVLTGNTGTGKTEMIEQICAKLKRECLRVNFTEMTDEDSLIGTWKLVNRDGQTTMEWQDGPVVVALKRGAVLLLDEMDCGTAKTMCLQSPLEGKGKFIERIIAKIPNSLRFNIVATCNTKGKGSDDGRFVGTRVMNEAMLDRFDFWFEVDYAPRTIEKKILLKRMKSFGRMDENFADCLTKWAESIRKGFADGAFSDVITTRRLINICKAYAIFGCKQKALTMTLARFDKDTQSAFISFYNKIDGEALPPQPEVKETPINNGVDPSGDPW